MDGREIQSFCLIGLRSQLSHPGYACGSDFTYLILSKRFDANECVSSGTNADQPFGLA
jgi:hypothetical protein